MEIQEIEVIIDKDGQVHLHVQGVKGDACLEITRPLEEALGGEIIDRQETAEIHEGSPIYREDHIQQHNGRK